MQNERSILIVNEASSWLGTPYHHGANIKGLGIDCAMLLVEVYTKLNLVPPIDPRPYPPDWHLHRSAERFLGWITDYAEQVAEPQPGDVALFQFGRCVSHGGIVETTHPETVMIHADLQAGCVERCEVRRFADRLAGYWRVR